MPLHVPDPSLVVLVGASGSGKSTLARRCFAEEEIVSSDSARAWVSGDAADQQASADAFEVVQLIVGKRLARNLLTVVDATNVEEPARQALLALARQHHVMPVAIVLDVPEEACLRRNAERAERRVPDEIVHRQCAELQRCVAELEEEGFRRVHVVADPDGATVERRPLPCDLRSLHGPFDIVGDVHGCHDELRELMDRMGWRFDGEHPRHLEGRTFVFLGDLVDRGPRVVDVLRTAMDMLDAGTALWVPGNHEAKLLKKLKGKEVRVTHGLEQTLTQLDAAPAGFVDRLQATLESLPEHRVLDGGRLVVAHAGMKASLQGRWGGAVRSFALWGESTGETDEYGLPIRYPWANDYRGAAAVAYGHTPIPETEWINETICLDTGCVFGGKLSALRWPERELVQVPAHRAWYVPARPFPPGRAGG